MRLIERLEPEADWDKMADMTLYIGDYAIHEKLSPGGVSPDTSVRGVERVCTIAVAETIKRMRPP